MANEESLNNNEIKNDLNIDTNTNKNISTNKNIEIAGNLNKAEKNPNQQNFKQKNPNKKIQSNKQQNTNNSSIPNQTGTNKAELNPNQINNNKIAEKQNQINAVNANNPNNPNYKNKNLQKDETNKPVSKPIHINQKNENPNQNVLISVVIPLLNEEDSLPELTLQLEGELKKLVGDRYEVLFIDDGSTDDSFNVLKQIYQRNRRFKSIRFRTNFGKSAALSVGFAEAKGLIVITMDADLQDDPAEIPNLIAKLKEGYDLVSGWKKKRHDPISKTIPSKFFNFVTSLTSGIRLHDFNCGLKAYKREVVKNLQVYGEMHRYLPALAHWQGFKVTEIPVQHHARKFGKTKFGFTRFFKGFLDLLTVLFTTRYFKRPLHFFGTLGTLLLLSGLGVNLYLTVEWAMQRTYLSQRPLIFLGVSLIIVGVQFISMGLLGELIVKNNINNVNYSIKEKLY